MEEETPQLGSITADMERRKMLCNMRLAGQEHFTISMRKYYGFRVIQRLITLQLQSKRIRFDSYRVLKKFKKVFFHRD